MPESYIQSLFAERIGGNAFGKDTKIYKFEKIKRAKRAALAANPGAELIDMGVGDPDDMAFPAVVAKLAEEAGKIENRFYADNGGPDFKAAVHDYMRELYGVELDTDSEILHTIGSKSALTLLPSCLIAARHLARKLARLPKKALVIHGDIAVSDDLLPRHGLPSPMPRALKTCAEGLLAVLLLLLCLPLACLLALLVKLTSPGPILYVATRLGQHARPFRLLKFRTMRPDADRQLPHLLASSPDAAREWSQNVKLSHDPRITPLGRLLRKTSLDELPQLLNVIRGDMAIIGPRPIVEAERPRYAANFPTLVSVKPGLTGLWQVSGRNDLTYSQRVALDIWYIEHWSIWLDLYILHKTLPEILSLHGR